MTRPGLGAAGLGAALTLCAVALGALPAAPAAAQTLPPGAPSPPARGPADAVLEVLEFSDFECPFCAEARPVIDSLAALHPDEVRVVYRHYPLPVHPHARAAAIASVEAARQGAFWPYHDLLFTHRERLTDVDLVGYADSLGLDTAAFAKAIRERSHEEAVEADVELGRALGVTGTPTFFVGGYRLVGVPPLWVLEEALKPFREGRARARDLAPLPDR